MVLTYRYPVAPASVAARPHGECGMGRRTMEGLGAGASAGVSEHARQRGAQSNLRASDMELVRRYGTLEHRTGVRFYILRRRDVERYREVEPRLAKLHDIVMIVASDNTVITVYRNKKALRDIRRKPKMNLYRSGARPRAQPFSREIERGTATAAVPFFVVPIAVFFSRQRGC
jgi:hypothetical protein